MARVAIFLLVALAALTQAALPSSARDAVKVASSFDQKAKPLCKECEKIIAGVKKILENPETETKLTDALKKICDLPLLSHFKDQCTNLANDVVVVLHELQALLDNPTQVCIDIKLCDSQAPSANTVTKRLAMSIVSKLVQDIRQPHPSMQIDTCGLCTSALTELEKVLQIPQLETKVEAEAQKICKLLGQFEQTCDQLVQQYLPQIFEIIEDVLNQPQQTCTLLHLCKQQSQQMNLVRLLTSIPRPHQHLDRFLANISEIQTIRGFKVGCLACEAGVGTLLKFLSSDKVVTSIATGATNFVCKLLPSSQVGPCRDFLGIYAKPSLQLTFSEWTSAEICDAMHVCKSSAQLYQRQIFKNLSPAEKGKVTCDACKVASKVLVHELQQPQLQQDIVTALTQVCLHLPLGKYETKCGDLVVQYIPFAMGWVADFFARSDACSILQLC